MLYWLYVGKDRQWHWRLKADNGKIIADSGEGYQNQIDCIAGIKLVKSSAATFIYDTEKKEIVTE